MVVDTIDYHQRLLPIITKPWHVSHKAIRDLNTDVSYSTPMSGTMHALLTPAIEAAHVAFNLHSHLPVQSASDLDGATCPSRQSQPASLLFLPGKIRRAPTRRSAQESRQM